MDTYRYDPLSIFGSTYGSNTYNSEVYNGCTVNCEDPTTEQTTQVPAPLAPLTGFFQQPSYVVLPSLLLVAVAIGTITYLVSRKLRKH